MKQYLIKMLVGLAVMIAIALVIILPTTAKAAELKYIGEIEFSAYWPYEDSYNNNFRCEPLEGLVGKIVAVPTGSDLLGEELMILTPDGKLLRRRAWDTGCKPGRMDMLVSGHEKMRAWGLKNCHVWVMEDKKKKMVKGRSNG